jgi:hypothetical protein
MFLFQFKGVQQAPLPAQEQQSTMAVLRDLALWAVENMPTGLLNKAVKGYGRSAKFLAHYMRGDGTPLELDLSVKDWQYMLKQDVPGKKLFLSLSTRRSEETGDFVEKWGTRKWYPAADGWEVQRMVRSAPEPSSENPAIIASREETDVWNILGRTALARRKTKEGGYEYQIWEMFDFFNSRASSNTPLVGYDTYKRQVPSWFASFAKTLYPELEVLPPSKGGADYKILSVRASWIEHTGKPFPVIANMKTDKNGNIYEINGKPVGKDGKPYEPPNAAYMNPF